MTPIYLVKECSDYRHGVAPGEAGIAAPTRKAAILFAMREFDWRFIEIRARRYKADEMLGVSFEGETPPKGQYPEGAEIDGDTAYATACKWAGFYNAGDACDVVWLRE